VQTFEAEQKAYVDFNVHFLERVASLLRGNLSRIVELTVKEIAAFQRHVGQIKRRWNSRISAAGSHSRSHSHSQQEGLPLLYYALYPFISISSLLSLYIYISSYLCGLTADC
jgi:hypothetical protein